MASLLFLVKDSAGRRGRLRSGGYLDRMPDLSSLDRMAYRLHAFGFPVWTFAALVAGPIWAQYAWGRYWGWDPKEVWAFITWVIYAAYLHARATAGWKGRAAAVLALVGLATLLFNFVGINFFFGGTSQHSYAS
jgi:cytochrome c-type biogenesis protein CcsB